MEYSQVVALWVVKLLQQFGFCRNYMFAILTKQDTLLSECVCQCVEFIINNDCLKQIVLALNIAICAVA